MATKKVAAKKRTSVKVSKEELELEAGKAPVIPESLAACADRLYILRSERSLVNAQLKKLEREEAALREHLIENIEKSDHVGVIGKIAQARIDTKKVPTVVDWAKVHAYIKRTGDYAVLQRRLSNTRVQEIWDAKKKIPGVDVFNAVSVSVTKAK